MFLRYVTKIKKIESQNELGIYFSNKNGIKFAFRFEVEHNYSCNRLYHYLRNHLHVYQINIYTDYGIVVFMIFNKHQPVIRRWFNGMTFTEMNANTVNCAWLEEPNILKNMKSIQLYF